MMMLCNPRYSAVLLVLFVVLWCSSNVVLFAASPEFTIQPVLHIERIGSMTDLSISELLLLDRARHAQILHDGFVAQFKLSGSFNGYGFYSIILAVGSPPKEYRFLIDSGSSRTWVKCMPATDRSSTRIVDVNYYDPNNSSTASLLTCHSDDSRCSYSQDYIGGSLTSGFLVSDLLYLPMVNVNNPSISSSLSSQVIFGCSNNLSEDFTTQILFDGILGLGYQPISLISQLSKKGLVPKAFSHCLNGGIGGGGQLVLGGIVEPDMVYTPLIMSDDGLYNVHLLGMDVAGKKLPIGSEVFSASAGTFVDSGTTFTYFIGAVYELLIDAIGAIVLPGSTIIKYMDGEYQCYANFSSSGRSVFPPITLNFAEDASILWTPEDYLFQPNGTEGGILCTVFLRSYFKQDLSILGATFLKDKIASYDLAHERLGLIKFNCSSPMNISSIRSGNDDHYNGVGGQSRIILVAAIVLYCLIIYPV